MLEEDPVKRGLYRYDIRKISIAITIIILVFTTVSTEEDTKLSDEVTIRIIATSDLHGKMDPTDYALNKEDSSGSMAQLTTAINKYKNENTVLVDAGDTIQDNSAGLFADEEVHPGLQWLNKMNYDIWVLGNHEFDYTAEYIEDREGDSSVTQSDGTFMYNYFIFDGIRYEVDISEEQGNRIKNLTWMDGTPIEEDDEFDIAVNSYISKTTLLEEGVLYDKDEMPQLVEADVRSDIGSIRDMIADYIVNAKGGVINPECDDNWKLTGF